MGSSLEWTASETRQGDVVRMLMRGATPDQKPALHRCAHRSVAGASDTPGGASFRCCYGAPNAARVSEPVLGRTFTQLELPLEELARALAQDPITRPLARDLVFFSEPKAAQEVLAKGPGDTRGFLLTALPLLWNPVAGAEFLVVAARSGKDLSFVVAFHVAGPGKYVLASSFVMKNEPGPIALAYNGYIRPRLHFSSCWGCPGETGKILYREPDQAVILQP